MLIIIARLHNERVTSAKASRASLDGKPALHRKFRFYSGRKTWVRVSPQLADPISRGP
jgi:hypothetical protein